MSMEESRDIIPEYLDAMDGLLSLEILVKEESSLGRSRSGEGLPDCTGLSVGDSGGGSGDGTGVSVVGLGGCLR